MKYTVFLAILFAVFPFVAFGQLIHSEEKVRLGIAAKVSVALGRHRASFSNLSFSTGVSRSFRDGQAYVIPGTQLTLNIYSKGLGTSMIDYFNRGGQLDFVTSFYVISGLKWNDYALPKYIRPFNQMSSTTIIHNLDAAISYGTSFIINNHQRNQQIGHFGLNVSQVSVGYYNDGFTPFSLFAGDLFDRYWTGGIYLGVGLQTFKKLRENPQFDGQFIEYAYDRFTGNAQLGYKLSKELLFSAIPQREMADVFYNRALSSITLRNIDGSHVGIGIIGQCPKCDIQDLLHRSLGYSRHTSLSKCIPVVHGSYQYLNRLSIPN